MLSEQERLQICRRYELNCPICGTANEFFRLKRDICRPTKTEGDGHPLSYRWGKTGFDTVDPKQFMFGVCTKCRFTGELDDADFRQSATYADEFRAELDGDGLRQLLVASSNGKGIAQSLGKRVRKEDPMGSTLAQLHLGVFCQSLRLKVIYNNIARYYLRIAWVFRDQKAFYPDADLDAIAEKFGKLTRRWKREVPKNSEFPVVPEMAFNELDALRLSRSFFERNYEMLREARVEDELRLRHLLAEIGYRIYELSSDAEDFQKASTFFSGAMQQCLSIISDKSIVGGVVNRAKEMLEICGDRGRELRELHKSRGGKEEKGKEKTASKKAKTKKAVAKKKPTGEGQAPAKNSKNGNDASSPTEGNGKASRHELDQAQRQIAVLQEEVTGLKGRLKELEEDNKKWRQLAGRDAVTGLPNKTMLFRLVIPKVLKSISKAGPFSCIALSLDQVAQVNQGYGWIVGDRMLKESAKSLRSFVQEGEELYRLDGVHFALVGPMSNNTARQRAAEMKRRLAKASIQVEQTQFPMTSSLGVVTVEQIVGKSPVEVANGIFEALINTLYRAKQKGGLEIFSQTRF